MNIDLTTLIVREYDEAITFFVDALGFDLAEDSPALTDDGRPKRWVVVRPPRRSSETAAASGLLLAEADGPEQEAAIGRQWVGRVGLFLHVDDFDAQHRRMIDHGVEFLEEPRHEPYGTVAVFVDLCGNKWDLLAPPVGGDETTTDP